MADPMLLIFDPDIAQQITVENNQPKYHGMADFLVHIAGPDDMVASDGELWRKWRTIFNPGFSSSHLMSLVPGIVDDSLVFCDVMRKHADNGNPFRLEETVTRVTVDIIGKVVLDLRLNTQRGTNEMVNALREQIQLLPNEGMANPLSMYYPYGIYSRWRNSRIMKEYIGRVLDERFASRADSVDPSYKRQRKRAIIDLALEAHQGQPMDGRKHSAKGVEPAMDSEFRRMAITQIRTFIFAGHDTTSSTICYAVYELQRHPKCLDRIREEHDKVLGPVGQTAQKIKESPHILNRLQYTLAVLRETLRVWPAASAVRTGSPGFTIRDPRTGELYPAEGMMLMVPQHCLHHNPAIWGDTVNEFDPTRFLPENEHRLPENGWRPFEKGPRNCIGQELALIESRVILALICRSFDFSPAYDALHELKNDGSHYAHEKWRKGKQDIDGEEAYAVLLGTAKPREGMPVRVRRNQAVQQQSA
ncbi:hypothetical protein LTR49_022881 [Elasticomyces elasticus]|nr:hypothetical protein LTR49_022881 [Elasticomyces elasticus]